MHQNHQICQPVPTGAAKRHIQKIAERVAESLDIRPGDLLTPIVTRLGGEIIRETGALQDGVAPASLKVQSLRDFIIYLPETTTPHRDRLILAHELGHLFLHFVHSTRSTPGALMVAPRWADDDQVEQVKANMEADWFAASFFMHEKTLENECRSFRRTPLPTSRAVTRLERPERAPERLSEISDPAAFSI